ncbi:D-aminoacyl-tRNA deacylase [Christiangramia sabulilitoris]|uniref:D-aminoacyl-tRNA deacylase n=1 Tax=Christiangramia sabulilitoris TaxID=2583991 RepID=A0A550HZS0_9FLAO|nr:D-aminoacyl-tRNA deacylase [Christiangramia sabulilitoris]TRO64078.1 D-tyrosyl-tRNA(Tyr) deacylase [Christiangramia sabulilitoris]
MKAVIQRVSEASVMVDQKVCAVMRKGLLILLGIEDEDGDEDIDWLCRKIINMRIFNDEDGVMNESLQSIGGEAIIVSQFTLHASTKKGNRPSYIKAAKPEFAEPMYEKFIRIFEERFEKFVGSGVFGGDMKVSLINDGPVTILLDSKDKR